MLPYAEDGEYLPNFPESAAPENTTLDEGGSRTPDGSYSYVVLHDGEVVAVYDKSSVWYTGFDDVYP